MCILDDKFDYNIESKSIEIPEYLIYRSLYIDHSTHPLPFDAPYFL